MNFQWKDGPFEQRIVTSRYCAMSMAITLKEGDCPYTIIWWGDIQNLEKVALQKQRQDHMKRGEIELHEKGK